jgi:amidohydrolase
VARNVAPLETAVVSFTMLHSGTAFNVIPQEAVLEGTIRTFDPRVRLRVLERFEQVVRGVAQAMGCQVEMDVKQLTPALINADDVTASVQQTARLVLPEADHDNTPYLTMGAEDMAFMQEKVPGCYFFVGSANRERGLNYGHHHPKFDFDEDALVSGAALMASAAADILR